MGLRTALRRLAKPVVMTLVAGSLALSLTVSTTQQAEAVAGVAVAPVIAAAEGVLAGGVRLALPSLLSLAIATTPVGWVIAGGLAIGALGVGLYSTRDYWLPFVTGSFGQDQPVATTSGVSTAFAKPGFTVNALEVMPASNTFTASYAFAGTSSTWYAYTGAAAACRKTDGSIGYTNTYSYGSRTNSFTSTFAPATMCPNGWTMVGLIVGGGYSTPLGGSLSPAHKMDGSTMMPFSNLAGGSTQYDKGPTNYYTWGSMTGAETGFDPKGADVKYKTTAECIDDGGNKTSITAEWFGDEGGAKVPSCAAAGKGHGTGKVSIEGYAPTAPGVPGTIPQPVWDAQAPPADAERPLCGPQRPGPGCEMKITIDGKPCTVGSWDCENWTEIWKDPNTAPRVGCTYGPYTLAVDACRIMEPAYRPGGAPATEENMDADPATRNYTNPGGTTYAPPATGTGTIPGVAGQPGPGSSPSESGCFPTGWAALNPVEWVMKPVGCALTAAFVPKPETVQAQQTKIQTKIQGVGFARLTEAWLSTFESVGGSSGCAGPTVNFNMQGVHQTLQPFNACSAPMSTVAGVSFAVSSISIVLFGGLGMIRAVASAFGFNFTLGKGSSE